MPSEGNRQTYEHHQERLTRSVRAALESYGEALNHASTKADIRSLHAPAVAETVEKARPALERHEDSFISQLLPGATLNVSAIEPRMTLVAPKSSDALLFRWVGLHWSLPVSAGYGRRLRFIIRDEAHDGAVIGILGLADPVFSMRGRDEHIGWNAEQRKLMLRHVMDAFVLGAVEPYASVLGAKLIASLTQAIEVGKEFEDRYGSGQSAISGRERSGKLAAITTTSAFGRSSIYNRLRAVDDLPSAIPVGYTKGTGDFHISDTLYQDLAEFARTCDLGNSRHSDWGGSGFRNRRDLLKRVLPVLGIRPDVALNHAVRRQVFIMPRCYNYREYLRQEQVELQSREWSSSDAGSWWRERWAIPRSQRLYAYRRFEPESWRLW